MCPGDDESFHCSPHYEETDIMACEIQLSLDLVPVWVVLPQEIWPTLLKETEGRWLDCLRDGHVPLAVWILHLQQCRRLHKSIWWCSKDTWLTNKEPRLENLHLVGLLQSLHPFNLVDNTPADSHDSI